MAGAEGGARRQGGASADVAVGVFDRDDLSGGLVATHRAGYGPHARVFDGARGELAGQLRRAGLAVPLEPGAHAGTALIVVAAPGRTAAVLDLLARAGARAVHVAARSGAAPAQTISPAAQPPAPPPTAGEPGA